MCIMWPWMAVCLPSFLPKSSSECQTSSQPSLPACPPWVESCSWQTQREQSSPPSPHNAYVASAGCMSRWQTHTHTPCILTLMRCIHTHVGPQTCQREHINPQRKYLERDYAEACKRRWNQPPSSNLHVLSLAICVKRFLADRSPDNHSCQWVKIISHCQVAEPV